MNGGVDKLTNEFPKWTQKISPISNQYETHTDGNSFGNPRPSGWGVVSYSYKFGIGQPNSTNNRMEMINQSGNVRKIYPYNLSP